MALAGYNPFVLTQQVERSSPAGAPQIRRLYRWSRRVTWSSWTTWRRTKSRAFANGLKRPARRSCICRLIVLTSIRSNSGSRSSKRCSGRPVGARRRGLVDSGGVHPPQHACGLLIDTLQRNAEVAFRTSVDKIVGFRRLRSAPEQCD